MVFGTMITIAGSMIMAPMSPIMINRPLTMAFGLLINGNRATENGIRATNNGVLATIK